MYFNTYYLVQFQTHFSEDEVNNHGCGYWVRVGQSCLGISTSKKTWPDARQFCQKYNADLIKVNSMAKLVNPK